MTREGMGEARDYSTANLLALIFSVVLLISFIFFPWFGTKVVLNGARVMSDNFFGAPGAIKAPWLMLVPIASVAGIGLALWGILKPERDLIASLTASLVAAGAFSYFVLHFILPINRPASAVPGTGFWLSMAASFLITTHLPLDYLFSILRRPQVKSKKTSKPWISPRLVPYLFLLPALVLYIIWIIAPTFYTFYLSLTNWDSISEPVFVGLENFKRLFTKDPGFIESLTNNVRWLLLFITVPTTLGLGMAMIFNTDMKGSRFFKISFYLPLVLSLPVIGLIWSWIYNPRLGLINNFLGLMGFTSLPGWLGDRSLAIWCVIIAAVWRQVGYVMVLYLAGLKNIDPTFVDAARVDGANRWNLFRHVIFPLLAPVTTIVVVISIIDSLRAFDLVSIMTRGGQSTQVLANFMYIEAFNNYRMGYAAAIAVVLFAISMVFIGFYLTTVIKDELEY